MDRMGWMNGWDGMVGMGWDGWMILCFEKVVSAHWLLTHIQSPPLRLLRNVH